MGCDSRGASGSQAEPREGRVPPLPLPSPPHADSVVRQLCVSGTALPGLVSPGRSQSERGHLHSESPSTSPFQPDCRHYPLRAHLRPPQALSGRSSAGLGKLVEGFPRQDAHRSAGSWAGWGGDPGLGSFPDPGGKKRMGGMRGGSLERKDGPVARRCPASIAPATRVTVAPTPGSARWGSSCVRMGSRP